MYQYWWGYVNHSGKTREYLNLDKKRVFPVGMEEVCNLVKKKPGMESRGLNDTVGLRDSSKKMRFPFYNIGIYPSENR